MSNFYIFVLYFLTSSAIVFAADLADIEIQDLSDIEVTEDYDKNDRSYIQINGKRFFTKTYGDEQSILNIAKQTKTHGYKRKVSTRYLSMPQGHVGSFITLYTYTFDNGKTFLYLESESFKALGIETDFDSVVIDTIEGGAFSSPMLWGPYDQIAGYEKSMQHNIVGDASKDSMATLKSSYVVGDMAILEEDDYQFFGEIYVDAINSTIKLF